MTNRQHVIPQLRILDGPACLKSLDRELDRLGCRRAVMFCGRTLAGEGSVAALVKQGLGNRFAGVFPGVQAHSPLAAVEAGADLLRQLEADAAIAIGGGSAIVTARAASILVAEGRNIHELCTSRDATGKLISPRLLAPKMPQFIVPTTPTTAMAKAGSAVLDTETHSRLALFDPKTRAGAIFLHPDLLGSAPQQLLVDASLNTFCSAVEGLMSARGDPISDAFLMHAARLYFGHCDNRADIDCPKTRLDFAYAAIMTGRATDHTAGGLTTALGHAIAAHCGIEGGLAKLIILPHAIGFNAEAAQAGLSKLAISFGLQATADGLCRQVRDAVAKMGQSLGVARRLRDADVDNNALSEIAEKAMSDWFLKGNPRPVRGKDELLSVLEAAW